MTTENTLTVANEIAAQIGARAFYMMGTRSKVGDKNSLTFDIKGCRDFTHVRVTLMLAFDLYQVEFIKVRGVDFSIKRTFSDIASDSLNHVIELSTNLRLSL